MLLSFIRNLLHLSLRFLLVWALAAGVLAACACDAEGPGSSPDSTSSAAGAALLAAPRDVASKSFSAAGVAKPGARPMVTTTVHVTAAAANATDSNEGYERRITAREVEQSAGTFGDPMRFMQMLPGVVSDNDQRNDFIVRGGNPSETLFVIDNIEMPSINQLALSDTTGGFVSMIDNAAVTHMTLHTDAYDSKFDQRLSAVMEMSTRPEGPVGYHMRSEFGVGGTGASMERPLGSGSLFVSLRRSILNLFTDDIGMNGVPIYTNGLLRADGRIDEKNSWWGLSLSGVDSMDIHPSATDSWETDPYNINYGGWRNTTGINWQHIFSARAFGVMSLSNSEQAQSIHETAQLLSNIPIYDEDSRDGITTLKYDGTLQPSSRLTWTAGAQGSLDRMNYNVQQPVPLPNPYSSDPTPQVAMSIERAFTPASFATYAQVAVELPHDIKIVVGERVAQWAIVGRAVATPKVVFFAPVLGARRGMMLHLGYAEYAQLPPSLYLVSFANQHTLAPIHSRHLTAGLSVVDKPRVRLTLNAYQKLYSGYPVAVSFPQLTMANIADTFGQEFLMFPMTSQGRGVARGIEMALDWKPTHRLALSSATTYMRSWYSGLDGVLRKGNFDLPVVANFAGNALLGRGWTGSFRYSGSTGKPYTPDNLTLSEAQDRDVYDLTQINSLRAPMYSRLDFRVEWTRPLRRGSMSVHIGLDNALATSNFYSNEWMPRCLGPGCGTLEQKQMPRFPDGGVRYSY